MCKNEEIFLCSLILTVLKLSNYFIIATDLPFESEIGIKISVESFKNDATNIDYEMPLDLTVKKRIKIQKDKFFKRPLINFMARNIPTPSTDNLSFFSLNYCKSQQMISDPLISSTILEKHGRKELKNNLKISNRHLRFFITKNNFYNMLTLKIKSDNSSQLISLLRKNLLISKFTMLNAQIDVVETITNLYFENLTGVINLALLKTEFDLESYSTNLISVMRLNPVHVKADPETRFILDNFSQTLYHAYSRSSFPFSLIKIARYIKKNHEKFSLKGLLNTFFSVIFESKHIQSDLKSIGFTILFFYNHAEKKMIKNMDFIVKDMIIRIILLVNLYKMSEEDVDQCLLNKQKFCDNIEKEIKKSFVMAFYLRDLKRAVSSIDAVKNEILHSELALNVDFSFVVVLCKTFKSVHCLKTILNGHKYESCEPLAEEVRLSCKKMFEFKESLFDIIRKVL